MSDSRWFELVLNRNEDEDPLAIDLEHLDNRQLGVCRNINKSAKRVCERDFKIKEVETSREEVKVCFSNHPKISLF